LRGRRDRSIARPRARAPESPRGIGASPVPSARGDTHNFGRRVERVDGWVRKPRTLRWEWLFLSASSPLRRALDAIDGAAFGFLPDLAFELEGPRGEGRVEAVALTPLGALDEQGRRGLAEIVGRALATFSFFGLADLHWENLALGRGPSGEMRLFPLDVELVLADLARPTETKLIADADPEVAAVCAHAAGLRRVLPFLGKPIEWASLAAIVDGYAGTLAKLTKAAPALAQAIEATPAMSGTPIRVLLRGTGDYFASDLGALWPPLLEEEQRQLARGDVPYFFRRLDAPAIRWFDEPTLTHEATLPTEGDVPQLDPLLDVARALRGAGRAKLADEGLLTVIGAFDHPSFRGTLETASASVTLSKQRIVVRASRGGEFEAARDLRAFVGSLYQPCHCGEVAEPIAPPPGRCASVGHR
jgi:hypothetical protein